MALPKRGSRIITVDKYNYRWMASGNDGWIVLYIELDGFKGQQLIAKFDYHHKKIQEREVVSLEQQFIVTSNIVRMTIIYGLKTGWKPNEKGKLFDLGHIDDKVTWEK